MQFSCWLLTSPGVVHAALCLSRCFSESAGPCRQQAACPRLGPSTCATASRTRRSAPPAAARQAHTTPPEARGRFGLVWVGVDLYVCVWAHIDTCVCVHVCTCVPVPPCGLVYVFVVASVCGFVRAGTQLSFFSTVTDPPTPGRDIATTTISPGATLAAIGCSGAGPVVARVARAQRESRKLYGR